jgi:hypothetical protein
MDLFPYSRPHTHTAEHEREVLEESLTFLNAKNPLAYELESKESPEPDVLVIRPEKEEYYELARILDYRLVIFRIKALNISRF